MFPIAVVVDDPNLIEQITPWIASGAVALLGILVGRRLERRDAHKSWLRDRQMDAYARFVACSNDVSEAAGQLHNAGRGSIQDLANLIRALTRADSEIRILGPADVRNAAGNHFHAHREMYRMLLDGALQGEMNPAGSSLAATPEGREVVATEKEFIAAVSAVVT